MKYLALVLALLTGLVIGNLRLKPELRRADAEIKALQEQLATRQRRDSELRNVTSLFRVPEAVPASPNTNRPAEAAVPAADPIEADPAEVEPAVVDAAPAEGTSTNQFADELQAGIELWKTRSELARNSFLSRIAASPTQIQFIDQAMTTMNTQLGGKVRQWANYMKQQEDITPETSLRLMNDLSGVVISTYDELDRVLPNDWRAKAGSEFQLFDFINPEVALPLAEVDGGFQPRSRRARSQ